LTEFVLTPKSITNYVGDLFICGNIDDRDHVILSGLTNKVISNRDVLRALILYRVEDDRVGSTEWLDSPK
jgi:hypothetical protein